MKFLDRGVLMFMLGVQYERGSTLYDSVIRMATFGSTWFVIWGMWAAITARRSA